MKSKILTFVCLFVMYLIEAQSDHVQTESVLIDNLITFIVDNIETRNDQSGKEPEHLIFVKVAELEVVLVGSIPGFALVFG